MSHNAFDNQYRCPDCGYEWGKRKTSSEAEDECPECGAPATPCESEEVDPATGRTIGGSKEPLSCPFCGDEDISGGDFQNDEGGVWRSCTCEACGGEWTEMFRFVWWKRDK